MIQNIVIGKPRYPPELLLACDMIDWEQNEKKNTLFISGERFLPRLMVLAGIVPSISEVRRNKPELVKQLVGSDYLEIKWGKKKLFIVVGE